MLDNASNNDTMVDGIASRAAKEGIKLNAGWARLRCLPHTIHLAAVKVASYPFFSIFKNKLKYTQLLEAIGAISKSEAQKAASRSGNYQDSVTTPLDREQDSDAVTQEDAAVLETVELTVDASSKILPAVEKVILIYI